jgi:hypothetical protein
MVQRFDNKLRRDPKVRQFDYLVGREMKRFPGYADVRGQDFLVGARLRKVDKIILLRSRPSAAIA